MYVRTCVLLWGTKFTTNWLLFIDLFQNEVFLLVKPWEYVCMYIRTYVLYVPCTYVCVFSFLHFCRLMYFLILWGPMCTTHRPWPRTTPVYRRYITYVCMYVCTFVAGPHANLDDTVCAVPECHWHPPVCVLFYRCCTYSTYVGSLCGLQCFMHTLHKTDTHTHFISDQEVPSTAAPYFDCHVWMCTLWNACNIISNKTVLIVFPLGQHSHLEWPSCHTDLWLAEWGQASPGLCEWILLTADTSDVGGCLLSRTAGHRLQLMVGHAVHRCGQWGAPEKQVGTV